MVAKIKTVMLLTLCAIYFMIDDHSNNNKEPEVEFFSPKMRAELERKDAEMLKKTGKMEDWVQLTSYCRVPVSYENQIY